MKKYVNYAGVIARKIIEDKAPQAANEIGFAYTDEVADQIEIALRNGSRIEGELTVERIEDLVDDVIKCWKEDTQINYPELCS